MKILEMLCLSAALSADAIGIAASCCISGIKFPFVSKIVITITALVTVSLAVFTGSFIGRIFTEEITKRIGAVLLILLGLYIIIGIRKDEKTTDNGNPASILRHPECSDIDGSRNIEIPEAVCVGIVISADSAAVGISMGTEGGLLLPVMCAAFQFLFLCMGGSIAEFLREKTSIKEEMFTVLSGIGVVVIGIARLF